MRITSDGGDSEGQNVCFLLHGSKEQVLLARCVLQNLVIDCEPTAEVLEVPQTAFGRIIGNCRSLLGLVHFTLEFQPRHRSIFHVCFRPWRREFETHNPNHGGQSFLFQREDAQFRCKGHCDN